MTRSLHHRPTALVRPGWWCTCATYSDAFHGGGTMAQARAADTAESAMVWMRLAVRTLLSGFDSEGQHQALHWLRHQQWEAVMRLKAGEPYGYTARVGSVAVEWAARPVLFLLPRLEETCPAFSLRQAPGHVR
ncbi:hypothetical protein OG564_11050 [Streptomyces sp. NBC_01280]|uniref:hypothetical protein n=1 Tax=Streptomyces sp. NBC_01280 TaxID=2903810 RepID=UPI002E31A772|nr:hypothetical protein [Streptomyces sp. NBC_01280]